MASARRFMQMAEQDGRHPAVRPAPPTVLAPVAGRRGPGMAGGSLHPKGLMEIRRNACAPQCDIECVPITAHCNQSGSESATREAPATGPKEAHTLSASLQTYLLPALLLEGDVFFHTRHFFKSSNRTESVGHDAFFTRMSIDRPFDIRTHQYRDN
jgi:hypothetical protein